MNTLTRLCELKGIQSFNPTRAIGKEWEIVAIEVGLSVNGVYYPREVLKTPETIKLFEGVKVGAFGFGDTFGHLPENIAHGQHSTPVRNIIGWLENARFGSFTRPDGKVSEGILAKFHVLEGFSEMRDNLRDAWEHGKWDFLGFSIDARGSVSEVEMDNRKIIRLEKFEEIVTTDLVSKPAAGGAFLRLVASKEAGDMKRVFDVIRGRHPGWLDGFADPTPEQDMKDYVIRILESNLVHAQAAHDKIPIDEIQAMAEVSRGTKTLSMLAELVRSGKVDEAARIIESWTEGENKYGLPYKHANLMEATKLGDFLKSEAGKKDVTVEQLAEAAGIEPGTVNQIMDGSIERPPDGRLRGFARVLKVSFESLLNLIPADLREDLNTEEGMEKEILKDDHSEFDKREQDLAKREVAFKVAQKVAAAELPELVAARIGKMFEDNSSATDSDIDKAIESEKEYVMSFSEESKGSFGLGNAHDDKPLNVEVQCNKEKIEKAFDGMFAQEDVDGVPRFTSLSEAWGVCTGDRWGSHEQTTSWIFESIALALPQSFRQGMEAHRDSINKRWDSMASQSLREAVSTTDFPTAFGDALFRRLQKEYTDDPLNDWRRIVSNIETLTDATNLFRIIRIGAVGTLPVVAQNAPYQELTPVTPTEEVEVITPEKRGGLFKVTWEDVLADRVSVIRRIPRMLARSTNRTIHELVWDEIESNPDTQDAVALINAAHGNLVSGSPTLSYAAVTTAIQLLRDQTELDSGRKLGLRPKYLLVGSKLETEAMEITDSAVKATSGEDSTILNIVRKLGVETFMTLGLGRTTATDDHWYVATDPKDAETIVVGFLGGRDKPEIFVQGRETPSAGAFFDADAITFKVRLVFGVQIADHRWIAGSLK